MTSITPAAINIPALYEEVGRLKDVIASLTTKVAELEARLDEVFPISRPVQFSLMGRPSLKDYYMLEGPVARVVHTVKLHVENGAVELLTIMHAGDADLAGLVKDKLQRINYSCDLITLQAGYTEQQLIADVRAIYASRSG